MYMCILGLGNYVTIIIVSVTIMTVIAKHYYREFVIVDIVWFQHMHNVKKHVKMARNISDPDKELEVFLLEGSKSDVWEYLVSLPQVENAQNLHKNFSFTIMTHVVFIVVQVSIRYMYMLLAYEMFDSDPAS